MGIRAKVIRGVYIRGKGYAEGAIVDLSGQEYGELFTAHYVVPAPLEQEEPAPQQEEPAKADAPRRRR